MAINYNDLYNQGIGTLDLGNMNVGQVPVNNMQVAEVFNTPQSLMDIGAVKPGKVFGYNLTDQGKALEDFRNSAVNFRNAPANTANTAQSAFNFMIDRPGSYGNVIENQDFIQDAINKGFLSTPEDYENQKSFADPDDLQAFLDDDEYDFSGIEGQTAYLGLPQLFGMIMKGGVSKNAIQKAIIKDQVSKQIGKRVRPHLVKTLRQKLLGEKFGGSGKFKNISTSNKNYGPYTQPTSKPTYTPPARPHGGGGARPDKPGGFTDPGKGSYGPHMAYGGRVSYFDGGLASLWPR